MAKLRYDEELIDSMINYIQFEEFEKRLKTEKRRLIKTIIKSAILFITPILSFCLIDINSKYFIIELFINYILGVSTIIIGTKVIKDYNNRPKFMDELDSNITHIDEEKNYIQLRKEGINTQDPELFYTDNYWIHKMMNNEIPNLKVVDDEIKKQLSKDDAIDQINENIKNYYNNYKLPAMRVTKEEFEEFYDGIYRFFKMNGYKEFYYEALSSVVGYTISKSMLKKYENIRLQDFIDSLNYLMLFGLSKDEIIMLKNNIFIEKRSKVIDISSYQKKYEKKSS